ncbi:MAG TPA: hypothetical protein VFU22_02725 [Roseiflexaceae bacterium]|nr:hypothetical protein [Roseiflexaceae bacterium]
MSTLTARAHSMAESKQPVPPVCKRCGRFLRTAEELAREHCTRCTAPAAPPPADEDERFCCASDPPCPSCPYVVGW